MQSILGFFGEYGDLIALAGALATAVVLWGMKESREGQKRLAVLVGLLALLIWSTGNDLLTTRTYWDNPKYSHGVLVPIIMAGLLLYRWQPFGDVTQSARWTGLGLLAAGILLRLLSTHVDYIWLQLTSFVPCVAAIFLLVGGWSLLRWAGAAVAFLIFMFPLPSMLDGWMLSKLQHVATIASTYCLQTVGVPTYSDGNRIVVGGDLPMGVVDACSGLRMLTVVTALAAAIALITDRPLWERCVIIASALPIAVAVNIVRITVTGILQLLVGPEVAMKVFHDQAGWVMMPLALGLLYIEFQLLTHLIIDDGPVGPATIGAGLRKQQAPRPVSTNA